MRALLHASGLPRYLWAEAVRHVVWLLNRTSTKAVDGKTPYEAAFNKKPDLSNVREWGEKVWVRVEGGDKLGGRVREGRWMGIDDRSKGRARFLAEKRTVTVERNVYYDKTGASASRLEGENWEFIETKAEEPTEDSASHPTPVVETPRASTSAASAPTPVPDAHASDASSDASTSAGRPKRARKPAARLRDILDGHAVVGNRQGVTYTRGVQLPTPETSSAPVPETEKPLEAEGEGDWVMMAADFADEYAMAAEISEVEALEPRNLREAKARPDWPLWEKAIEEELRMLRETETWTLVEPPEGANVVGSKWVFRAKKDAAGNVVRYKARLVAQGFSQVPGVDYFDTYAPVARLALIRAILALAAAQDMEIHQIDIKGAYLNGKLTSEEKIFMRQPPGYAADPRLVCRLQKTLYGLKQSGRRWYQHLVEILVDDMGFKRCEVDQAVFHKRSEDGKALTVVMVHVDDCTIAATSPSLIADFKSRVAGHVDITDLGELHWLLGIEVRREREAGRLFLSQRSYLESIIRRYGFDDLKPLSIPMDPNVRLSSAQSPSTTQDFARMRDVHITKPWAR